MNALLVGSDKEPLLQYIPPKRVLIIDDGPFIDALGISESRTVTFFDPAVHCFNPLKDMDYRRAREFVGVLDSVFPEGESTLTKRYSNFQILQALLGKPRRLDGLIKDSKETADAYQKIQTLMLSPVLEFVLNHPTNMSFKGSVVAKLDRAVLGDFDCFVLANLLISQFQGAVVIPDFGFYATRFHTSLLRQNRLIAGINSFDEVPDLKNQLLMVDTKIGSRCTYDDAVLLALYAGIPRDSVRYGDFLDEAMRRG